MNRRSFIRKLIYIVCIGILLVPLSYYSQPATVAAGPGQGKGPVQGTPGGKLAQLREQEKISAASLGEIDPTGETIKLATLGLRGVAVTLLWEKAKTAQMKEDWDGLQATLDQLTKLEPHFHKFWRHQAWNVSYNISVEWDDYHDRYFWVKEGIKLLLKGMRYNDREALLVYDVGWTTAQKMGVADEKVPFRRLFREDDDEEFPAHEGRREPPTHPARPQSRRDNWLVGQEYYNKAIALVEDRGGTIHHMNPLVFYSEPAMCQIDYASNLEEDGIFEEKAKVAWVEADDYWNRYGSRSMPTSVGYEIRLNDQEDLKKQAEEVVKELEALAPGLREKIVEERRAKLPAEELAALNKPAEQRSMEENQLAFSAAVKLNVSQKDLADRVDESNREQARQFAKKATELYDRAQFIDHQRQTVNFNYWRVRCRAEKTDPALEARRLIYEGKGYYENAQLEEAQAAYGTAFAEWRKVIDEFPELRDDSIGGTSIEEAIKGYFDLLKQLDEPFPKDFPLKDVARSMMLRKSMPVPPEFQDVISEEPASPAGNEPETPGDTSTKSDDDKKDADDAAKKEADKEEAATKDAGKQDPGKDESGNDDPANQKTKSSDDDAAGRDNSA